MIKLISIDLDGTLLNQENKVEPDMKETIAEIQDRGIRIVVNTGRDYRSASRIAGEAGIRGGIICCNGSEIYDGEGKQVASHPRPADLVRRVEALLEEEGFILSYFTHSGQYMLLSLQEYRRYSREVLLPLILSHGHSAEKAAAELETWRKELRFCKRQELERKQIYKLNAVCYRMEEAAKRVTGKLVSAEGVTAVCTNMGDMEITMPRINKGSGLLEYIQDLDITLGEILVMGDSENDLPAMLLPGICSVAMGNAKETIQSRCKYCTAGNGEGGVKKVLKGLLEYRQ